MKINAFRTKVSKVLVENLKDCTSKKTVREQRLDEGNTRRRERSTNHIFHSSFCYSLFFSYGQSIIC